MSIFFPLHIRIKRLNQANISPLYAHDWWAVLADGILGGGRLFRGQRLVCPLAPASLEENNLNCWCDQRRGIIWEDCINRTTCKESDVLNAVFNAVDLGFECNHAMPCHACLSNKSKGSYGSEPTFFRYIPFQMDAAFRYKWRVWLATQIGHWPKWCHSE